MEKRKKLAKILKIICIIVFVFFSVLAISIIVIHSLCLENNELFNVFLNISYSYIAALIFHLIVVILPRIYTAYNSVSISSEFIDKLYEKLSRYSLLISKFLDYNEDDFVTIQTSDDGETVYYKWTRDDGARGNDMISFRKELSNVKDSVDKLVLEILSVNSNSHLPPKLIKLLLEMRLNINSLDVFQSISSLYPVCQSYQGISRSFEYLEKSAKKLKKYTTNSTEYCYQLLTKDEIKKYQKIILKYK